MVAAGHVEGLSRPATGRTGPAARLRHIPALDGLRGLSLVAVLAYHDGRFETGYLGVEVFFVLSGFLITSLLLSEAARTERIALGEFWKRRLRRLFPALAVFLLGITLYAMVVGVDDLAGLRRDALATLAYVANWNEIAEGSSYWDLFKTASPLGHTWTLAIEEQFYLVWPLVVAGAAWLCRRKLGGVARRLAPSLLVGCSLGAVGSAALMWWLYVPGEDPSRVYQGTDTRASGILLGAALAAWLSWRPERPEGGRAGRVALELVGFAGIAVAAVAAVRFAESDRELYRGGFLVFGLATVAVIAAASHVRTGPLAAVLSLSPLRLIGRLSYGLYLWHWPVDVALDPVRTGLDGWRLSLLRVAVTAALAGVSYVLVEQPVRVGRLRTFPVTALVPAGMAVCFVTVVLATAGAPSSPPVASALGSSSASASSPDPAVRAPAPAADRSGRLRLLLLGDSVANSIAGGRSVLRDVEFGFGAVNGCPLTEEVEAVRVVTNTGTFDTKLNAPCLPVWHRAHESFTPDVVAIVYGNATSFEEFSIDGRWLGSCDKGFRSWYLPHMRAVVQRFVDSGSRVFLSTLPPSQAVWNPPDTLRRVACMNALNTEVVRSFGGVGRGVESIDLAGFVCPGGECRRTVPGGVLRPDGAHFGEIQVDETFRGAGSEHVAAWLERTVLERVGPGGD